MRHVWTRGVALAIGFVLLTSAYYRSHSAALMSEAANRWLASLTPEQRQQATFRMEDDERLNWHFIPRERKGLPLRAMTPPQKHLAAALLSAGLSQQGYIKAVTIMSLEDVLRVLEGDSGERRNPEKYYFSIFGVPSETGVWGYRVEGHHLSQNYAVVNGRVAGSPSFFGANPAQVPDGPRKGLRTLAAEEDLGRALVLGLEPEQRQVAVVDPVAYKDILTSAGRRAALEGQPSGLPASPAERPPVRDAAGAGGGVRAQHAGTGGRGAPGAGPEGGPQPLLRLGGRQRGAGRPTTTACRAPPFSSNTMTPRTTPTTSIRYGATSTATSAWTC